MDLLIGTSRGLFRSLPGDESTELVLNERGVRELINIGAHVFAGTSNGLFVSQDRGLTWRLSLAQHSVWQVRANADASLLYASTEPAALFRSEDQGRSWQEVESLRRLPQAADWCVPVQPKQPARARALVLDANNPQRLCVGVEVGGVLCTQDGGSHWQLVLPRAGDQFEGNSDIHMMCAHPREPNVIFASTGYGRLNGIAPMIEGNAGVFRSDDGGASWKYVWWGVTPRYSRPMCIDPRAPYALTVASAPNAFSNAKEEGGAKAVLFQSIDRGATWLSLGDAAHSPAQGNFHGLAPDPSRAGSVLVGNDLGEVWQVSSDCHWQQLNRGLPTVLSVLGIE